MLALTASMARSIGVVATVSGLAEGRRGRRIVAIASEPLRRAWRGSSVNELGPDPGRRMAMAINQDAVERLAEASALRVLVQTIAVLVFEQSGLPPDRVRSLGQSLSTEMSGVEIPGASEPDLAAIREANARAVVAAFESVAEAMRGSTEASAGS